MLKYKVYKANPAIRDITKLSDLIPTDYEITLPGNYTRQQITKILNSLNLLPTGADVNWRIKTADTKTSIYIWRDITFYQANNSASSTNIPVGGIRPLPGTAPATYYGGAAPPNQPTPVVNKSLRNSSNYPVATAYSSGATPTQVPELLIVLLLENRVSAGPIPNLNKNVGTTRALNVPGVPGNGDPGLPIQMRPIYSTPTLTQLENNAAGQSQKNGNFVPQGTPVPAGGQIREEE